MTPRRCCSAVLALLLLFVSGAIAHLPGLGGGKSWRSAVAAVYTDDAAAVAAAATARASLLSASAQLLKIRGGGESTKVKHIGDVASFDKEVAAAGDKLVVVDFTASWCGPCKMIAPAYDELSTEYADVVFLKVDVDEVPEIAERFQVMAMPTFLFLKQKAVTSRFSGASVQKLRDSIDELK